MVSASRRRADHFRWFEEESRAKYRWMGGSEANEDSTDNQRHILIYKGDSSLILQEWKHYFALHVIYPSLLASYSVSTRSSKVSLKVFEACR
jgi:hypothetical protein